MKYQQWRTKMMMLNLEPNLKKKKGAAYFQREKELDDEWVKGHLVYLVEEQRNKIQKKFEKENEQRIAEGEKPIPDKELKDRMKVATELERKLEKERKSGKVEAEGKSPSVEKLEQALDKLEERIQTLGVQQADREDNKEIALGTSKIVSKCLELTSVCNC